MNRSTWSRHRSVASDCHCGLCALSKGYCHVSSICQVPFRFRPLCVFAQCRIVGSLAACTGHSTDLLRDAAEAPRTVPPGTPGIVVPRIYTEAEVGTQYLHFSQAAFTHETCRTDARTHGKLDRRATARAFLPRTDSAEFRCCASDDRKELLVWGIASHLSRCLIKPQPHSMRRRPKSRGAFCSGRECGSVRLEPYSKT